MSQTKPAHLSRYLVESYWPGVSEPTVVVTMRRARQAAQDLAGSGRDITYVRSYLVTKDEVAFCLFDSSSVSMVEEACRRAELPFDRIVPVVEIDAA